MHPRLMIQSTARLFDFILTRFSNLEYSARHHSQQNQNSLRFSLRNMPAHQQTILGMFLPQGYLSDTLRHTLLNRGVYNYQICISSEKISEDNWGKRNGSFSFFSPYYDVYVLFFIFYLIVFDHENIKIRVSQSCFFMTSIKYI